VTALDGASTKTCNFVGLPIIVIGTLVASALMGFSMINQKIGRIYENRVVHLTQLKNVSDAYVDTINIVNKADDGLISPNEAVNALKQAKEQIERNWNLYKQGGGMDPERQITLSQNISSNIGNMADTSNNTQNQIERAN
jgi:methyl-accepting chemotaxis protein